MPTKEMTPIRQARPINLILPRHPRHWIRRPVLRHVIPGRTSLPAIPLPTTPPVNWPRLPVGFSPTPSSAQTKT